MKSIRFRSLILLSASFGLVSALSAGPSIGKQTVEGGPVSAGPQSPGPQTPTNPAGAARSDSTQSGGGGNGGSSVSGGGYSGRDNAAACPGHVRDKVTEVDTRAPPTRASDGKFQQ